MGERTAGKSLLSLVRVSCLVMCNSLTKCRSLKRKVLLLWHQFIPVAKEEKLREQRKDELRKKVAKWLPDYQTATNSED